jgi:hypothetical protein
LAFFGLAAVAAALAGCADGGREAARDGAAAERAAALAADARLREERVAALEAARLADLWTYHDVPAGNGRQLTASIRSSNRVDTDGSGGRSVQLVFRDHPTWGRSSYLVLQAGDFDCSPRCTVPVTVDDGRPVQMAARRPNTEEAIAMFIDDAQALWRMTSGAHRVSIEFPVDVGGTRTVTVDVAGLDRSKMPGWD